MLHQVPGSGVRRYRRIENISLVSGVGRGLEKEMKTKGFIPAAVRIAFSTVPKKTKAAAGRVDAGARQ
jgi:hypothetical protein